MKGRVREAGVVTYGFSDHLVTYCSQGTRIKKLGLIEKSLFCSGKNKRATKVFITVLQEH